MIFLYLYRLRYSTRSMILFIDSVFNSFTFLCVYFIGINGIGSFLFIFDKMSSIKHAHRVKENHLHFIELCGGIFSMFLLIFIIRHKSKKMSYYSVSILILMLWLVALFFLYWNFSYVFYD